MVCGLLLLGAAAHSAVTTHSAAHASHSTHAAHSTFLLTLAAHAAFATLALAGLGVDALAAQVVAERVKEAVVLRSAFGLRLRLRGGEGFSRRGGEHRSGHECRGSK